MAVIRLSGPEALAVAARLLPERAAQRLEGGAIRLFSLFRDPASGEHLDQGLIHVFRAPRSSTGEDVVELHGHGGRVAPRRLLDAVLRAGARHAEPGAFTRRALLNGKIDLVQAEALLDLIEAPAEGLHRQAVYQLTGALSRKIAGLRESLVRAMAHLELAIDFPEDDVRAPAGWREGVTDVRHEVARLIESFRTGELLRHGVRVALAGLPNVGKSSLFNCMLGEERAIVSTQPGTTRDAIEAEIRLDGFACRLVDTAGLREARDEVEALGVERTRRQVQAAQIVLVVLDATQALREDERALLRELKDSGRVVVALNKSDMVPKDSDRLDHIKTGLLINFDPLWVSAVSGEGREALLRRLLRVATLDVRFTPEELAVTRLRQRHLLASCLQHLDRMLTKSAETLELPELLAADLRDAADDLSSIVGVISSDDVLDRVFSQFCIGK